MKQSIRKQIIHGFFIFIPLAFTCLLISASIYLQSKSYTSFIHDILVDMGRTDLTSKITRQFFPIEKFKLLRIILNALSVLSLIAISILIYFRRKYFVGIDQLINTIIRYARKGITIFNSFSYRGKISLFILLIVLACRSIYYATSFYIQYDEAWNYNFFLAKQFYYTMGAYNNYPLHNIVSWFFVKIFGNAIWVLRLPSILIGLLTTFSINIIIQYFFCNEKIALIGSAFFACMPVSLFYMMYARGVLFEVFFCILISTLLVYYIQNGLSYKRIIFLALLNALGTYSMLSHPYFILASSIACFVYAILKSNTFIPKIIVYFILSIFLSLLLLLPMHLGTGLSLGLSAAHGSLGFSISLSKLNMEEYSYFITGFSSSFYLLFLFNVILLIINFRKNESIFFLSLLNLSLLILPMLIAVGTGIFPPQRALSFLVIIPVSTFCLIMYGLLKLNSLKFLIWPLSFIMIGLLSYKAHTHHFLNWSKKLDALVYEASVLFNTQHIQSAYNDCRDFDYFIPGIEFYHRQLNNAFTFYSSSPKSTRYLPSFIDTMPCVINCSKQGNTMPNTYHKIGSYNGADIYIRTPINK